MFGTWKFNDPNEYFVLNNEYNVKDEKKFNIEKFSMKIKKIYEDRFESLFH